MTIAENILHTLQDAERRIRAAMAENNENASHRTERSLHVEQDGGNFRLVIGGEDTAPAETLEIGRPAGKVPMNFTAIIDEWMQAKGIGGGLSDKERMRLAGAIAWGKIRRFGTNRHLQPVDIYSSIVRETVAELEKQIKVVVMDEIKKNF